MEPVAKPSLLESTLSFALALAVIFPASVYAQASPSPSRKEQAARFFVGVDACAPERVPLTMREGIALAQLTINQKPMTFIVDSAGTTMVNSDHVSLPVVRELRASTVTVSTMDAMEWKVVNISSLGLGKRQIHDLNVLSRSLPQLETKMKMEIDGILGSDMLMWWDFVALDYAHKALMLASSRCSNISDDLPAMLPDGAGLRRKRSH